MRAGRTWIFAVLMIAAAPVGAHAGFGFSIGVGYGVPIYRPYWGCGYYYRPYPVYVVPPPVYVQAVPVVPAAPALQPIPVAQTAPTPGEVEHYLQQLNDPDAPTRAQAALQLGRLRNRRAIDSLNRLLATDRSPSVREAAARALGLIGAPGGLGGLQRAASSDEDRDVRQSAQFAAESIRASLQGR